MKLKEKENITNENTPILIETEEKKIKLKVKTIIIMI